MLLQILSDFVPPFPGDKRMSNKRFLGFKVMHGVASLLLLVAITALPVVATAAGNRVYYTPVESSFSPYGSLEKIVPEGYGKGINKVTVNASPYTGYTLNFTINNNNNGTSGTTFFETRKGPGNNDLSPGVLLSPTGDFYGNPGLGNTTFLTFPDNSTDVPLYVQVEIPACPDGKSTGTFRIQAHPGGEARQGNGPGVVVFVNCKEGFFPYFGGEL
jgi:hypothetical protein